MQLQPVVQAVHDRINTERVRIKEFNSWEVQQEFIAAMQSNSLRLAGPLIADGQIHRCDASNKEGWRGKNDGVYVLHMDGVPAGGFRNYTLGGQWQKWCAKLTRPLTEAEKREISVRVEAAQEEHHVGLAEKHKRAQQKAIRLWHASREASVDHPYLLDKGLTEATGLRELYNGRLLVPLYNEEKKLQSLQYIYSDGGKIFLKGGKVGGCHYWVATPKEAAADTSTICICEGWATGESIYQATNYPVVIAFNSNNLRPVGEWMRKEYPDHRIVICADDDWKTEGNPGNTAAWEAARAVNGLVASPRFKEADRKESDTDFNDMARYASDDEIKRLIDGAVGTLLECQADPAAQAQREARLYELAVLRERSRLDYEAIRTSEAKELGMRVSVLDEEVAKRVKKVEPPASVPVDVKALAESAKDIIASDEVLELFINDFGQVFAGERRNAKLLYLAATSRLLPEPMHVVVKGASAVGKSGLRKAVLSFYPPEHVVNFTALSEKALFFMKDDFAHKVLSMGEAMSGKQQEFQDLLLRELMSAGKLCYQVAGKDRDGTFQTTTIEKDGPVSFMVTTTRNKLNTENETCMLSLEVDDSEEQTEAVMAKIAEVEGLDELISPETFRGWHDYQRWLAAGECRVVIPFAPKLAKLIYPAKSVRLRRDFGQLLHAVKAHALLHREHRRRDDKGRVVATVMDDYRVVCELMATLLAETSEVKLSKAIKKTVEKVEKHQPEPNTDRGERLGLPERGVSVKTIAQALNLDVSSAWRRLRQAEDAGFVINLQTRPHRPGEYRTTDQKVEKSLRLLPEPDELLRSL